MIRLTCIGCSYFNLMIGKYGCPNQFNQNLKEPDGRKFVCRVKLLKPPQQSLNKTVCSYNIYVGNIYIST